MIFFVSGLIESRSGLPIPHSDKVKVRFVCQDLLNLASRQLLATPKALVLGLSVKHLTGSKEVINILHRLGHCASYDRIRAYETSLAAYATRSAYKIPERFASGALITLVWDNMDFLEETLTGQGTTHHTNGIMTQLNHQIVPPLVDQVSAPRGVSRLVAPISDDIVPLPSHTKVNSKHLTGCDLPGLENLSQAKVLRVCFRTNTNPK